MSTVLLSDLLRQIPDLRVRSGRPERLQVHRIAVLDPSTSPLDGSLYLHADPLVGLGALARWHRQGVGEQVCVLTPAAPESPAPPLTASTLAWLEFGGGEPLPLDLSARLLRVLLDQPRGPSELEQLRDELVEELLTHPPRQTSGVLERAADLGLDLSTATQVIVVGSQGQERGWRPSAGQGPPPSRQRLLAVTRRAVAAVSPRAQPFRTGAQVAVLFDARTEEPATLAHHLAAHLHSEFPTHYVLAALGEPVSDVTQLASSYRTARAALDLGLERPQQTRWVSYDRLRHLLLYREIRRNPDLTELIDGSLRPLLDLPGEYRQVLLRTLAAYLEHNRSPHRAAAALGVHPNTLKYRMRRISELMDLQSMTGDQFVLYYLAAQLHL